MPSLKDLKNRIASVKSTRKITAAMKMVAASKLKRAQEQAEAARPYAEQLATTLGCLAAGTTHEADMPRLLRGTGRDDVQLLVVVTSDRGLCGAFNGAIVREARQRVRSLRAQGRQVKLLCVGRKGRDLLKRDFPELILDTIEDLGRRRLSYADAETVAGRVLALFAAGEFDVAHLIYNRFRSVIAQIVTSQQIVPLPQGEASATGSEGAIHEFEPEQAAILAELLPRNLTVQIYRALLESAASEQGARMTAMDNATRNAGAMIDRLTLTYNRTRQAYITKELIEIISGAEAI